MADGVKGLRAEVTWGDYTWEDPSREAEEPADEGLGIKAELKPEAYEMPDSNVSPLQDDEPGRLGPSAPPPRGYRRIPRLEQVEVPLPESGGHMRAPRPPLISSN